jgi:sugar-specific transcriptional regulator TrmB
MVQNPDLLASLRRLGLNQYEAKSYYALASTGECTAGELSNRADLPRPRVYDVLTALSEKGFVAVQPSRPVIYRALPISEAVRTLRKQRQESLGRELSNYDLIAGDLAAKLSGSSQQNSSGAEENVWTLRGRSALYARLTSMIEASKKHVLFSSTPSGIQRKFSENAKFLEKARGRGVKISVISPLEKSAAAEIARIAHTVTPSQLPTRMVVADDQALIFLTNEQVEPEDEVGVWINNPHVASTLRQLFPQGKQ